MLQYERQQKILAFLETHQNASVRELAAAVYASEASVRRDIASLESRGIVERVYGGVLLAKYKNEVVPVELRDSAHSGVKDRLAAEAAKRIRHGDTVMMDASTSVMEMIPYLRGKKNLTIITCCLSTAIQVSELLDCILICTGGRYHAPVGSLVGVSAESTIKNWFADIMFFSVHSIHPENGLTDQGEEIAHMKSAMLNQARKAVLLADSSKFGQTSSFRIANVPITHIITNSDPRFDEDCWKEYRSKMIFTDNK